MEMDFLYGFLVGFLAGFGILYITYHKSIMTQIMNSLRRDVSDVGAKLDKILEGFKLK